MKEHAGIDEVGVVVQPSVLGVPAALGGLLWRHAQLEPGLRALGVQEAPR